MDGMIVNPWPKNGSNLPILTRVTKSCKFSPLAETVPLHVPCSEMHHLLKRVCSCIGGLKRLYRGPPATNGCTFHDPWCHQKSDLDGPVNVHFLNLCFFHFGSVDAFIWENLPLVVTLFVSFFAICAKCAKWPYVNKHKRIKIHVFALILFCHILDPIWMYLMYLSLD